MQRIARLSIVAVIGALTLAAGAGAAAPQMRVQFAQAVGEPEPLLQSEPRQRAKPQARPKPTAQPRAQARVRPQARPRARIVVRPHYPYRRTHSTYPIPYPVEYPGPRAKRHCENHYEVELRPSGGVVTPRMRCVWVQG